MKPIVKQIKNQNGTFAYSYNGEIILKSSKKDFSFCLSNPCVFSSSYKNIVSQKNYWLKYGNQDIKNSIEIIEIIKS